MSHNPDKAKIIALSDQLYKASKSIRILRTVNWAPEIRANFFKHKAQKLPKVSYPSFDPSDTLREIETARKLIVRVSPFEGWATRIADKLESSAYMLANLGTADFLKYSRQLYGVPSDPLPDGESNSLDLAHFFESMYENIDRLNIGPPYPVNLTSKDIAARMLSEVKEMFGDDAPEIIIDEEVSSNVIAGRRRIRIRKDALFSDKDIEQLIHHEAFIHVATSINGHAQKDLKILAASHPGTTKTQEGLAVFAEFITGNIDLDRLRRLSDRIVAIQMAIDGADFIEVFRYFNEKIDIKEQAFESTRRVFRGGLITGGAPFTKDIVYLDGLLRVHNFLRFVVAEGRADLLPLLFVGKLGLEDVDVFIRFKEMGLLTEPKYFPPWIKDIRYLLTYLSYSSFLNSVKLPKMKPFFRSIIDGK